LFSDYQVLFTPQSLILSLRSDKAVSILLDRNNFDILQDALRMVFCLNTNILGE
jgi:hypothetical protein